jgi:hypothetical protein
MSRLPKHRPQVTRTQTIHEKSKIFFTQQASHPINHTILVNKKKTLDLKNNYVLKHLQE